MKPRPKWIAAISPGKRASRDAYNREAREVIEAARNIPLYCPVALAVWSETIVVECVHHLRGKNCEPLRHDKRGWLLVSMRGHSWIHHNPNKALAAGWRCPNGKWGTPFKDGEAPMPGSVAELEAKNPLRSEAT
jgi:hypothetical protein